jgi:hypothetical protein
MKSFAVISAVLLMTTATVAQSATQTTWIEIDDDDLVVASLNISVDDLDDMDLYNAAGEEIGEVEEVLGTEAGVATAVAVEFDEGPMDDETVIFMISDLAIDNDRLITQMTADQIASLEVWDD